MNDCFFQAILEYFNNKGFMIFEGIIKILHYKKFLLYIEMKTTSL